MSLLLVLFSAQMELAVIYCIYMCEIKLLVVDWVGGLQIIMQYNESLPYWYVLTTQSKIPFQ